MDYYKEMKIRIDKYRRLYSQKPRIAVLKMMIWNLYFLFRKCDENSYKSNYLKLADLELMEQRLKNLIDNNLYKNVDNLLELQVEVFDIKKNELVKTINEKNYLCKMNDRNIIDIVFITDNNYAIPTSIAISSLYYNSEITTDYHVYILGVNLSKDFSDILISSGTNITIIPIENRYQKFDFDHEHVSKAALSKFNICEILPELSKVIYLDSDIIVQKDLLELYQIDLKNSYAAVVKDLHVMGCKYKGIKMLGLDNYFNSGMMLLNLDKMRDDDISEKLLKKKIELNRVNTFSFMDQDAFNAVFQENVIFTSVNYNFLNVYYRELDKKRMSELCNLSLVDIYNIYDTPAILHIGGRDKPWNTILGDKSLLYKEYIFINKIYKSIYAEGKNKNDIRLL